MEYRGEKLPRISRKTYLLPSCNFQAYVFIHFCTVQVLLKIKGSKGTGKGREDDPCCADVSSREWQGDPPGAIFGDRRSMEYGILLMMCIVHKESRDLSSEMIALFDRHFVVLVAMMFLLLCLIGNSSSSIACQYIIFC